MTLSRDVYADAKRKAALGCATTRALLEEIRLINETLAQRSISMGVGGGGGKLFVYGDYDSIKAAQALTLR
jgi:hypothetical protein